MTRPSWTTTQGQSLSTPMGVDYVVIGFDMEVQPLVTHNAAWPLCSARAYGVARTLFA